MSLKLLIVDDSNFMRRNIERNLGEHAFAEIRTAGNGVQALEQYRQFRPDVVTMDITMPNMDGLSCVEALLKENKTVRILVISALADASTAVEAVKRGAQGFLLKPFSSEELQEAMQEVLED